MMTRDSEPAGRIALALGPAIALGAAGLLSHFRDSAGSANVALVLAAVVVAAALAGRTAGAATAVTASLAYNYFHTRPYASLRINSGRDLATVLLLLTIGLVVSEMNAWRRRIRARSLRHDRAARVLETTAAMLAAGAPSTEVWDQVHGALVEVLGLAECRFEPGARPSRPVLARSGALVSTSMHFADGGFLLPDDGAAVAVTAGGTTLGYIVLVPADHTHGSALDERQTAIALADQYATSLARSGWEPCSATNSPASPTSAATSSARATTPSPSPKALRVG